MLTETTPPPPTSFSALTTLAYVESDRYCDKCAYNLRGQPVRRDPATQLALCRCPECETFHPANDHATALRPWIQRLAMLGVFAWLLLLLWIIAFSVGGQIGIMGVTIDELGRSEHYETDYAWSPRPYRKMDTDDLERRRKERMILRVAAVSASAALGFISVCLWTILFPHWSRDGYQMVAIIAPLLSIMVIAFLVMIEELRRVPSDAEALLFGMFAAHVAAGLIASAVGRPIARGLLRILLPPRVRALFSYLWIADGKKPPHAAAA